MVPPSFRRSQVRRKDRAVDDQAWIVDFLHRAPYGSLAMAFREQPYIVTRTFAYEEAKHAIYLHGATQGRTLEYVRANPQVAFSVAEMGRLLPASRAGEFGVEYRSVVAFGRISMVTDPEESRHGLYLLLRKYFPALQVGEDYQAIRESELKATAVLRMDIDEWSGKEKKAPEDFPGAFDHLK